MGRKQKLRQEKRNIKNKAAAAAAAEVTTAADARTDSTEDAIVEATAEEYVTAGAREIQFPKSDMYFQAMNMAGSVREMYELFRRGAIEDGCIHCMFSMGQLLIKTMAGRCTQVHVALPWILEGAIRGSFQCTMLLMEECYLFKDEPNRKKKADALQDYWGKIMNNSDTRLFNAGLKIMKRRLGRKCAICSKTDTETLTLTQCMGCSFHCYCSETCQTIHWKERKHRNECKQLRILNKYHKPYFTEIRDAVIRGDKEIPALEKLRYKLGLTRPHEEYDEFYKLKPTHNGNPIDPDDYLIGREDGTLWVGSVVLDGDLFR